MVRGSFQLNEDMHGVRALWRLRGGHVEGAARSVQHIQKALTQMNVQLAHGLSDISGKSGQAIIAAILWTESGIPPSWRNSVTIGCMLQRRRWPMACGETGAMRCCLS
jgi:hypothetical protein